MPSYIGTKILNALPLTLQRETKLNLFKTKFKNLLDRPLYSVEDFFNVIKSNK